jgi:hypothetical protein
MMNEENEQFEQRLRRQPVKQVPGEWRAEILAAARGEQAICHSSSVIHKSWLSTLNAQLSTFFWPHPKAWAGLAAIWLLIFTLNFSMRDRPPGLAVRTMSPPSPEVLVELRQQHRLYADLIGAIEPREADRRPFALPKPRSGRTEILAG